MPPQAEPYLPPTPLADEDWSADDAALRRILSTRLSSAAWKALEPRLSALGRAAPHEVDPLARRADAHPPQLRDDGSLVFDASYRDLQRLARDHEAFTLSWRPFADAERAPRVATFALGYLYAQAESGYFCPACMTDGAAFVIDRHAPALAERYVPRLVQEAAEGAFEGAMFLTEKRGGSDVGATETVAEPADDGSWRLSGHKWFCSNADAEVILTLARMPEAGPGTGGLGLFVVPATLPDGTPNPGIRRLALKDKLGVRSMATAETMLEAAYAELVAPAPDGFKAMLEMVNLSRLYNAVASVAAMRRALREGQKNGVHRKAFGRPLREHPLYALDIAALANDTRAALHFVLDMADVFDRFAAGDRDGYALLRALTPPAKAMTARLSVDAASAGCEFLGGNGFIEDWVTPRLLRDAQVLTIWEGTTNIQALDFLRAAAKDGAAKTLVDDSVARIPAADEGGLREAWAAWGADVVAPRAGPAQQIVAKRLLERAYHLRAATLLAEDAARDGDAAARAHFEAYLARRVRGEAEAFENLVLAEGETLCEWPEAGAP